MRKVFSLTSFVAALAVVALLSFSFTGSIFAQTTPTPTAGTDTEATTEATDTADTTATTTATDTATTGGTTGTTGGDASTTTGSPSTLPSTAEGNTGPLAPPIVFVLLLAMLIGAVGFFSLAARRNAER